MSHHLFSKTHLPFWKERIRSCRSNFLEWIADYEAGKKTLQSPLPSFSHAKGSQQRYRICFGCRKVDTLNVESKRHECDTDEERKKTVEMYKNILNEEVDVELEEIIEEARSSEEVKKLQEKVAKLEKEYAKLKKRCDDDTDAVFKSGDYRDALTRILDVVAGHPVAFDAVNQLLEADYQEYKGDYW